MKFTEDQKKDIAWDFMKTGLTLKEIQDKHGVEQGHIHTIVKKYKPKKKEKNLTGILLVKPKDLEAAMNILAEYYIEFEQPKKAEVKIYFESKLNFT